MNHHDQKTIGASSAEPMRTDATHTFPPPRSTRSSSSTFQFSSGAFQAPRTAALAPPVKPSVPAKQPRGRLFVIGCVVSLMSFAGYSIYDGFFRYSAYGVIAGRTIVVPAPKTGFVRFVHVQESETVRQGQLMMTLYNPELEALLNRTEDEMRLARAKLQAGVTKLKWDVSQSDRESSEMAAEIHEKTGMLLQERAKLQGLQQALIRLNSLNAQKVASPQEVEACSLEEQGQREKVDQLLTALTIRSETALGTSDGKAAREDELLPLLAEVEGLEAERQRIQLDLDRLQVRAPVNGRVLRRHRFTGEGANFLEPLFTIVEEDSEHVELFVLQERIHEFPVGTLVNVQLAPFWDQLPCRVVSLGDEHVNPPTQIERHYDHNVKAVTVHLVPDTRCLRHEHVQIGAIVKLPSSVPLPRARGISVAALPSRKSHDLTRTFPSLANRPIGTENGGITHE